MQRLDEMVLKTQKYLNATYNTNPNWVMIDENGKTGWPTIRGLIRGLQIEIGISTPNGNFGPATEAACPTLSKNLNPDEKTERLVYILQGAMWCKGFSPGGFTGTFGEKTESGIKRFQESAGLAGNKVNGIANPMIFKALLNMDAYVLVSSGDPKIREIQMNLNRDYHKWIGLRPTDGRYGRDTNKALIYAIQVEEGIAEPNGVFGPTTQSLLPTLSYGSSQSNFVKIAQYALYCNRFDPTGFTGTFGNGTISAVREFQKFCMLTNTGNIGPMTWASLLVSCGDKNRKGTACDCSSEITPARAKTLRNNGYEIVGRYIAGGEWKKLKKHEAQVIFDNGLRLFPIFQKAGNSIDYFTMEQGKIDGQEAVMSALEYGFPDGTIIYFAVDFDAVNDQVTSHIIPYFRMVKQGLSSYNPRKYKIGVYGARNICSRVGNEGISTASFVSDMSTGFSGNLGYPLPRDWSFDQIKEFTIGSGEGAIAIDNNICSNRDRGVESFTEPMQISEFFKQIKIVQDEAIKYARDIQGHVEMNLHYANLLVIGYIRQFNPAYLGFEWDQVSGPIDKAFCNIADKALGNKPLSKVVDLRYNTEMDLYHLAATLGSLLYMPITDVNDAAGWGGDLVTLVGDAVKNHTKHPDIYPSVFYAAKKFLSESEGSTFTLGDLLADIDAINLSVLVGDFSDAKNFSEVIEEYFIRGGCNQRFRDCIKNRFGQDKYIYTEASSFLTSKWYQNVISKILVEMLKKMFGVEDFTDEDANEVARAFSEYMIEQALSE